MIDWRDSRAGLTSDRYDIILDAPNRWLLRSKGALVGSYRSMRLARADAARIEGERLKRRHVIAIVAATVIALVAFIPTTLFQHTENPAYDDAVALGESMSAAYDQIVISGLGAIKPAQYPDITASLSDLPSGDSITGLVGSVGGECYVVYWHADAKRRGLVLSPNLPCELGPIVASSSEHGYSRHSPAISAHLLSTPGEFDWKDMLPDDTIQRSWFLPAMMVLVALVLWLLIRLMVVFIAGRPDLPKHSNRTAPRS